NSCTCSSPQQIYGIRSTTYPSYALNLAQLGGFVFQIFVQQSPKKLQSQSQRFTYQIVFK
ncbi:hypothetical protein Q3V22_14625, partial [Acinetobacter baumannii]|nr:hypothetical protein [Acinetobacter baumannii]